MYRPFSPSEEMVGVSDLERAVDSRSSNKDAMSDVLAIAKQMNEVEVFLSASRSYVDTSKTVLEDLKMHSCIAQADILSAVECITESEMRLKRMKLEVQAIFQNIFYQDLGHCNRYVSNERKSRSTQTTSSMSEHAIDVIKKYAKNKSIDLNNYTATCDEYDGATFIILHQNNMQSKNSLNLKRDSQGSSISYRRNIFESSASDSGNVANRDYTTLKDSESKQENFEGVTLNNPKGEASFQTQSDILEESSVEKRTYNSKPTQMSCEIYQRVNDSLPVKKHRQHSFQTQDCNVCPNLSESTNEASFTHQTVPQIGSNQTSASTVSTRSTELLESEKTDSDKLSDRQLDATETEGIRVGYSRNPDILYTVQKRETAKGINGNTISFVTQSDGDLTKASNGSDFISNKDNESGSGSVSHASSSRETVLTFPLQSRLARNMSFRNTSETMSQFFQTGARKASFCNRKAASLIEDFMVKSSIADKVQRDKCDRRNNNDVSTCNRSSPDITVEGYVSLNDGNKANSSKNVTLNVASNNISKTTVPSNSSFEYDNVLNPHICYQQSNPANNTLQSFTSHGKPYSSSQKEVSNERPLKIHKEMADVRKSDSRNSMGYQTSPEGSTTRSRKENFCRSKQKQLNSKDVSSGKNSRKLTKRSEHVSNKELFGQNDSKNMLLINEYSDSSVSEIIISDNPSIEIELEYFENSSDHNEPDYGSVYKCASAMSNSSESERYQNVSSICLGSSTATNHSRLSQTPRSSVHPFGDHRFGVFHSPGERAGLLNENSLNINASFTNTGRSLENYYEKLQDCSSSNFSRTSVLPLVYSLLGSPTPMQISSSSAENSP